MEDHSILDRYGVLIVCGCLAVVAALGIVAQITGKSLEPSMPVITTLSGIATGVVGYFWGASKK